MGVIACQSIKQESKLEGSVQVSICHIVDRLRSQDLEDSRVTGSVVHN